MSDDDDYVYVPVEPTTITIVTHDPENWLLIDKERHVAWEWDVKNRHWRKVS